MSILPSGDGSTGRNSVAASLPAMRCEVVAIGTELLLGQIVDTNSSWIGEQLALSGIDSHFQTKVGDNVDRIVDCIRHRARPQRCGHLLRVASVRPRTISPVRRSRR